MNELYQPTPSTWFKRGKYQKYSKFNALVISVCKFFSWRDRFAAGGVVPSETVEVAFAPGYVTAIAGEKFLKGDTLTVGGDGLLYRVQTPDEPRVGVAHDDIAKGELFNFNPATGKVWKIESRRPIVDGLILDPTDVSSWPPLGRGSNWSPKRFDDSAEYAAYRSRHDNPLRGLHADGGIFLIDESPGVRMLGRVLPKFGSLEESKENNDLRGNVFVEYEKVTVLLDQYYDIDTIKQTFGNIEFEALDFLPMPSGLTFEHGGAVKKFRILNWVLENVPAAKNEN